MLNYLSAVLKIVVLFASLGVISGISKNYLEFVTGFFHKNKALVIGSYLLT